MTAQLNQGLPTQATNRHLKSASELTLLAPLKSGFVKAADVMSYATRLRVVLKTLFELRRVAIEVERLAAAGPLERLRSLFDVRFGLIDDERKLLLAVTFDRSWDEYIQGIVDEAGPLLDLIFSHCEDYAGHTCRDGFTAFSAWVRAHQVSCDFFYTDAPDLTVDDRNYLTQLVRNGVGSYDQAARIVVTPPIEQATEAIGYRALSALHDLRRWFEGDPAELELWNALARVTIPQLSRLDPRSVTEPALRRWLSELRNTPGTASPEPSDHVDVPALRSNVQASVLTPCRDLSHGVLVLLRCGTPEAMRALLSHVRVDSDLACPDAEKLTSLALTYPGLALLPLTAAERDALPAEFREGMAARAGLLGDIGPDSPEQWELPEHHRDARQRVALQAVDAVVIIRARRDPAPGDHLYSAAHPLSKDVDALDELAGVEVLHVQPLRRYADKFPEPREHFGFVDPISQPVPDLPELGQQIPQRDRVALGEIILGYPNARGEVESGQDGRDLLKDGTFMVLRKLAQDVGAFEAFAKDNAARLRIPEEHVKSAVLGREHGSSRPLVEPSVITNDFDYSSDPQGERCPLHAHIRRVNPRQVGPGVGPFVPRILRRGFPYGTRYGAETKDDARGLCFIAYNASIARQYEVIQRWLNGGNSSGGFSGHTDLLVGNRPKSPVPQYLHVAGKAERLLPPERSLVRLHWGMYLFVPSLSTLERFRSAPTDMTPVDSPPDEVERGRRILTSLAGADEDAWKRVLEDVGTVQERAALWAAIRKDHGGVMRTPYGVLIGSVEHAQRVLADADTFSVSAYGERMQATLGLLQLGVNPPSPQYDALARLPNTFAADARFQQLAPERSHAVAAAWLSNHAEVDVQQLIAQVLLQLAAEWFGLPRDANTFERLLIAAKYVFQPAPNDYLETLAHRAGPELRRSFRELVQSPPTTGAEFLKQLQTSTTPPNEDAQASALLSLAYGFVAATFGSTLVALDSWIESGVLWRLARDKASIEQSLNQALLQRQSATVIHRTCAQSVVLGGVSIEREDQVVVGLGSTANDAVAKGASPAKCNEWLFGGTYGRQGAPAHACPGRDMAVGVMVGLVQALLERRNLRRMRRFVLSHEPDQPTDGGAAQATGERPPVMPA